MVIHILLLSGFLLASIALVQAVSLRFALSESVLLAAWGFALGGIYLVSGEAWPHLAASVVTPALAPRLPPEAYLWIFLPLLLFQAALSVNVREMLGDAAPILLLAVVAVFVATAMVGGAIRLTGLGPLTDGLLLGAMIATTDPSAVLAVFREVGAPARLVRLVEGESLLNDAAAIAIASVLIAAMTGDAAAATGTAALRTLGVQLIGGLVVGGLAGRAFAYLLPVLGGEGKAEISLSFALPYPLYLFADQVLHVSGVVSVVAAGLVISGLGRTRLSPVNWMHLQLIWEQVAAMAGAAIFLLAAMQIPATLRDARLIDLIALAVVVVVAFVARLVVAFGMLPLLSRLKLTEPVSAAYKLVIAWGGLRGAVTLVLAMGLAQNEALPESTRRFVAILATGFVLVSLIVNGSSLKLLIRRLKLDLLSPQEEAIQQQAVQLSSISVSQQVHAAARTFRIPDEVANEACATFRRSIDMSATAFDIEAALSERERLAIGLVTLAAKERDLIPQYGSGIVTIRNLDAMTRNTDAMIEAARESGRIGYQRAAAKILADTAELRVARFIARWLHIRQPYSDALADRFELLMCRRVVLHELIAFADTSLTPLLGERLAKLLGTILRARIAKAEGGLDDVRSCFGHGADVLEQRMMLLYALREGRARVVAMYEDRSISKEIYDSIRRELDVAWKRAVPRAHPGVLLPGEAGHRAAQRQSKPMTAPPPSGNEVSGVAATSVETADGSAVNTAVNTADDAADDTPRSA
ncbi:CPA1 family monovalent cation:H+ antiporter [Paraburkholderia bannensis]|uniref:CPA1 family monovalent cation:H+ antiporter n=1 Tax=Paraburkholderia bannensis TaxID=765414 RepID=A0A7W9TRI5_9BURK|nr:MULTISPECIES: cation:proton antiporter [Paraburkholderia]MBB3255788.1 CPA1 family monovalent cation:H+ antiporter [Paraburkholderia sp. WP4_3_2]MBB6100201.1 CPA1 family monovalent cation:H+ antiporter [Paraburkholderia bannensis]